MPSPAELGEGSSGPEDPLPHFIYASREAQGEQLLKITEAVGPDGESAVGVFDVEDKKKGELLVGLARPVETGQDRVSVVVDLDFRLNKYPVKDREQIMQNLVQGILACQAVRSEVLVRSSNKQIAENFARAGERALFDENISMTPQEVGENHLAQLDYGPAPKLGALALAA